MRSSRDCEIFVLLYGRLHCLWGKRTMRVSHSLVDIPNPVWHGDVMNIWPSVTDSSSLSFSIHSLEAFFNCPIPFHVDWFAVVGQTKCINFPGTPLQTYAQTRMYLVTAIKASVVFICPRSRTFSFDTNLRWWVSGDWWCWQHKVKGSSGFIRKSQRSLDKPMYVLRNYTWKTWIGRLIQTGTIPYIDFPSSLRGNFERNMISIENSEGTI